MEIKLSFYVKKNDGGGYSNSSIVLSDKDFFDLLENKLNKGELSHNPDTWSIDKTDINIEFKSN